MKSDQEIIAAAISPVGFALILAYKENGKVTLCYYDSPNAAPVELAIPDELDALSIPSLLWSEKGSYLAVFHYGRMMIYQRDNWELIVDRGFLTDYFYGWQSDTSLIYEVQDKYTTFDVRTNQAHSVQYNETPYLEPVNLLPGKMLNSVNLTTLWWLVPNENNNAYAILKIDNNGRILKSLPIQFEEMHNTTPFEVFMRPLAVNDKYVVEVKDDNTVVILQVFE
jgi:hypothetical protein